MLSRLRTIRSTRTGIARIFAVAMLALVLLAGMIPSAALSAIHSCKMACCAGKPPHEAGACDVFLPPAEQNEITENAHEHSAHHEPMQMQDEAIVETEASSHHCQTQVHASAQSPQQHQSQHASNNQQAGVSFGAFTKPCSAACSAVALSTSQVRRPRDAASHSIAARPRPPAFISLAGTITALSFSSAERRRQSRPRAPPISPVNFSA